MERIAVTLYKPRRTLNIEVHNKALILKALIKTNFNTEEACKLNHGEALERSTYLKQIHKYFPQGITALKMQYIDEKSKQSKNRVSSEKLEKRN